MIMSEEEYLYGKNIIVPLVPTEVANERIRLLDKNLHQLLDIHYRKRDDTRVNKVIRAIKFWKKLRDGKEIE